MWIWIATGLAILAILSEWTLRLLLSKATPVAVQLPGFLSCRRRPSNRALWRSLHSLRRFWAA
jgi:hypothetical protein